MTRVSSVFFFSVAVFSGIHFIYGYVFPADHSQINESAQGNPKIIPEVITDYVTSLMSNVNARVEELERSREENIKQMAIMQKEMAKMKTENINLNENLIVINEFLRKKGLNINDILSRKQPEPSHSDSDHSHCDESLHSNQQENTNENTLSEPIAMARFRRVQTFPHVPSIRAGSFGENVAFHAVLGHDLVNPGKGYEMVFGQVLTNTGASFSNNTGTFTCGAPGTYVFFWTVTISSDHWTDIHLVRNGQMIGIIVAGNAYHYGSYTGTTVIHLDVGDEVFVKVDFHQENTTIYSTASAFSGFKLF